jgi:TonB family protein
MVKLLNRIVTLVVVMWLTISFVHGQPKTYYDRDGKVVDEKNCYVFTAKVKAKKGLDSINSYYCKDNSRKQILLADKYGMPNGDYLEFYEGGSIKSKGRMENGVLVDTFNVWYSNGSRWRTLYSGTLKNPQNKIVHYWDSTGRQLIVRGNGYCRCYEKDGKDLALMTGTVRNGLRDSIWHVYNASGTIVREETLRSGAIVSWILKPRKNDGAEVFTAADEPATPSGGMDGFYKIIAQNIKYPAYAFRQNISGKVFVTFVVETDGSLSNVTILKGIGGGCDEEAARVVLLSPQWNPGKIGGKVVRQSIVLPISFRL